MIDTLDLFHRFPNGYEYDKCYATVDKLSRESTGQAVHKDNYTQTYITTAFASEGFLKIAFLRTKYHGFCYITLKPALLLHPDSHIRLAQADDFYDVCKKAKPFINKINRGRRNKLPHLSSWHVSRVDYAVNIETPHVAKYIRLFHAGNIPTGFKSDRKYDSSFYIGSANGTINFYDKL